VPQGGPFRLFSDAFRHADTPSIGMNARGDFVTTYHADDAFIDGTTVWARRFNADGIPQAPDERIGTSTSGRESSPSVAIEADGDYVIIWHERGFNPEEGDVYARRFSADGSPRGEPFRVNTYLQAKQNDPSIAVNDTGAFVVTWTSWEQDGSMEGIYGQLYDAEGEKVGREFQVNQNEGSQQMESSVAMDASGRFAVTWKSSFGGVMLRRFGAGGAPLHDERDVDGPNTAGDNPFVVSDAAGGLVLAWEDYTGDVDFIDTFFRRFGPDGAPLGAPARANTTIPGTQGYPSLAMRTTEDFVVVWSDAEVGFPNNPNATQDGVYARRFVPGTPGGAAVTGRHLFYNRSSFDGNNLAANAADDAAIATDKAALSRAGTASFSNVSTYSRGINGVMIDLASAPADVTLTAADLSFRSARGRDPSAFSAGPSTAKEVAPLPVSPTRLPK
jgi:hypothetical protein